MNDIFLRLQELLRDRYRLERELGGGGMAMVYLTEDLKHHRPVAIKVLRPEFSITLGAERFLREIEVVARLQHPHILPLLDSGITGATAPGPTGAEFLYFVMPYVEGDSLRGRLSREGRLPIADVIRILADVADALAYAHGKGIVHRDIKPDNVMLTGRHAVVMDFGVAKAVSAAAVAPLELTAGVALGTPAYMAPEQATADPALDHRVDLYALGVLGYELLAGRPPFTGATAHELLTAHVLDDPDPVETYRPDVPPALAAVVLRCLAKKPADRYNGASDVLALLEPMLTPSGGITPTGLPPVASRASWRGLAWAGGAALLVALALLLRGRALPPAPPPAPHQVSFQGDVLNAALSPDGQQVALLVQEADSQRLVLQELRGGETRALADEGRVLWLGWNQEGTEVWYLLFQDGAFAIRRVGRLGGMPRTVATFSAVPSPDGRWGAFWDQRNHTMLRRDLASGDSVVLPPQDSQVFANYPTWSPRSDRVAIITVSADRVHYAILVCSFAPTPRWSVVQEDTAGLSGLTWDAGGRGLYYLRNEGPHASLYRVGVGPDGDAAGTPVLVRPDLGDRAEATDLPIEMTLSADGSRLTYVQERVWTNLERTRVEPGGGASAREPLTTGTAMHTSGRLSPDGATLAFIRQESGVSSVMLLPLARREARSLGTAVDLSELSWAPDGRHLGLSVVGSDSGGSVEILDPTDASRRRAPVGRVGYQLTWGPDGIFYQEANNRTIRRYDPLTGTDNAVPGIPESVGWVFTPRVSPDGAWLALLWNRKPGRGLWLVSTRDGTERQLSDRFLDPVNWSRDGRTLYAALRPVAGEPAELWAFTVANGSGELRARFGPTDQVEDIAADGASVVLSHRERRADAWMLELPRDR